MQGVILLTLMLAISLRVVILLQNRSLTLDEVNLVRNLHERGYSELLQPLSYNQFAPIPFLILGKFCVSIFGYYEWAIRLYPFVCGIAAVLLFYCILTRLDLLIGGLYPLLLMASGLLYVRYATEFKQYSSDEMITMLIVLMAIDFNPIKTRRKKLLLTWCAMGSIAIWFSMPSIFVLAGVGISFLFSALQLKERKLIIVVGLIGLIWIGNFLLNYFLLLQPSIASDYLQSWHKGYFLFLFPSTKQEWQQNADVLSTYWGAIGGHWVLSFLMNLALYIYGTIVVFRKYLSFAIILFLPIILLLITTSLHQYTLLSRVVLFSFPLILLSIAYGIQSCDKLKKGRIIMLFISIGCIITLANFNSFKNFILPMRFDWTKENFIWAEKHKVSSSQFYVHELCAPQCDYYLNINPDRRRWASFRGFHTFGWKDDFDSLCASLHGDIVFSFSWMDETQMGHYRKVFDKYYSIKDSNINYDRKIFFITKRN